MGRQSTVVFNIHTIKVLARSRNSVYAGSVCRGGDTKIGARKGPLVYFKKYTLCFTLSPPFRVLFLLVDAVTCVQVCERGRGEGAELLVGGEGGMWM